MRSFIYTLTFAFLVGLAFWAYQENIKTKNAIAHTEKLQKEIGIARAGLSILMAEWAYLNRPDRLTELVDLKMYDEAHAIFEEFSLGDDESYQWFFIKILEDTTNE